MTRTDGPEPNPAIFDGTSSLRLCRSRKPAGLSIGVPSPPCRDQDSLPPDSQATKKIATGMRVCSLKRAGPERKSDSSKRRKQQQNQQLHHLDKINPRLDSLKKPVRARGPNAPYFQKPHSPLSFLLDKPEPYLSDPASILAQRWTGQVGFVRGTLALSHDVQRREG